MLVYLAVVVLDLYSAFHLLCMCMSTSFHGAISFHCYILRNYNGMYIVCVCVPRHSCDYHSLANRRVDWEKHWRWMHTLLHHFQPLWCVYELCVVQWSKQVYWHSCVQVVIRLTYSSVYSSGLEGGGSMLLSSPCIHGLYTLHSSHYMYKHVYLE